MGDHSRNIVHHVAIGNVLTGLPLLGWQALVRGRSSGRDCDGGRVGALLARRYRLGSHGGSRRDAHQVIRQAREGLLGLPRLLADHSSAQTRLVPLEELVAEGTGVRPTRDLAEAPSVELAGEAGILVHTLGPILSLKVAVLAHDSGRLRVETVGALRGEVARQNASGEDIRTKDNEGLAVGKPRDDIADSGVSEKCVKAHGEGLLVVTS
jgi:hypothetical protein